MATPRKHHFRCADEIIRVNWPAHVRLMWVLLQAHLNTRWSRDGVSTRNAGSAVLSTVDLAGITLRRRADIQRKTISLLHEVDGITVHLREEDVLIEWPKYVKDQELHSRSRGKPRERKRPRNAPTTPHQHHTSEEPERARALAGASRAAGSDRSSERKRRSSSPRSRTLPDVTSEDLWQEDRLDALFARAKRDGYLPVAWSKHAVFTLARYCVRRPGVVNPCGLFVSCLDKSLARGSDADAQWAREALRKLDDAWGVHGARTPATPPAPPAAARSTADADPAPRPPSSQALRLRADAGDQAAAAELERRSAITRAVRAERRAAVREPVDSHDGLELEAPPANA